MLAYERRVVAALLDHTGGTRTTQVTDYVDGALGAMPEVLRAGIAGLSLGLGTWSSIRRIVVGPRDPASEVAWLETHPVGLVRQWLRAIRSLVIFAHEETLEAAST